MEDKCDVGVYECADGTNAEDRRVALQPHSLLGRLHVDIFPFARQIKT